MSDVPRLTRTVSVVTVFCSGLALPGAYTLTFERDQARLLCATDVNTINNMFWR
jgi:hypothetical protein